MTDETWFIDVNMDLPAPLSNAGLDMLMEAVEPFGGSVATGPGVFLGLSLVTDAKDFWDAAKVAKGFLNGLLSELASGAVITSLRVLDDATRTKENRAPRFPELMSVPDIADLLGVTRQMARKHTMKAGFPVAALTPRTGSLWTRAAVESWNERTERHTGRPRITPPLVAITDADL